VRSRRTKSGKELIALKILELRTIGGSVNSISKEMQISPRQVRKVLDCLNTEARRELENSILSSVPLQWKVSIELYRQVVNRAMRIASESKDTRVVLQAQNQVVEVNNMINQLIEDSKVIHAGIQRIQKSNQHVLDDHQVILRQAKALVDTAKANPIPKPTKEPDNKGESPT